MLKFIILKLFTIFILLSYFYLVRTHGNIRKKRIVGGNVISFSKIPYIVSIQQWRFQVHQCGGSIIGEKWVLTSAHCHISVVKFTRRYFVLVGSNYKATKGYHFNIIDSFKHPNFSRISMDYDIELLKLSKSIIKHTGGQIIKLPKINDPVRTGQVVRVSGWGWNKYEVDNLRSVELDIIDHKKCNNIYSDRVNITENMICASSPGKDACHSDSGGPMTITDYGNENDPNDDHEILVGIISWGAGCADTKYPGVYTKVSAFIQWIADTQKHRILGHHFRNTKFYGHKKY